VRLPAAQVEVVVDGGASRGAPGVAAGAAAGVDVGVTDGLADADLELLGEEVPKVAVDGEGGAVEIGAVGAGAADAEFPIPCVELRPGDRRREKRKDRCKQDLSQHRTSFELELRRRGSKRPISINRSGGDATTERPARGTGKLGKVFRL